MISSARIKLLAASVAAIIGLLVVPNTLTYAATTTAISPTLTRCPSGVKFGVVTVGNLMFYGANDGTGCSLWKSDGTESGTAKVASFPGTQGPTSLTDINGTLFFMTADGWTQKLWKSDGTTAGTVLVSTVNPSAGISSGEPLLTNANGIVLFNVNTGSNGSPSIHLWRSDGTESGTYQISDVRIVNNPGTSMNGEAYFIGYDSNHGEELWHSDGTANGTTIVSDINPGSAGSFINLNALGQAAGNSDLKTFNNLLYFTATDGVHGQEVWKSDGTTAGTTMITDVSPCNQYLASAAFVLGFANNKVIFENECNGQNSSVWATDGTAGGTAQISTAQTPIPQKTATMGNTVYFTARDASHGYELWKTDGTGASMVKDIYPGANAFPNVNNPVVLGNTLYFGADDGIHGNELWKSDGTTTGTTLVTDLTPGSDSNYPTPNTVLNNTLYFNTSSPNSGWEDGWQLWKLTDSVAVTAPTDLTAVSPTKLPVLSWSAQATADHYDIFRNGVKIDTTTGITYTDSSAPEGTVNYYVIAANASSTSGPSNTISVLVDKTAPVITSITWSSNPLLQGQSTVLQVGASDILSGISKVWYTIDGGSPKSMIFNPQTNMWEDTFGSGLGVNTYSIDIYTQDQATNSSSSSDVLAVYNAANGYVTGHERLLPSVSDTLPIALDTDTNNPTKLVLGLTNVKAATSTTPTSGSFDINYVIKQKKNEFSLSSTSVTWLVVPDNQHASILGFADLTTYINGTQTVTHNVPVRIDLTLGTPDHVVIKIYDAGVNPNTGTPRYVISDDSLQNSQANIHP